MKTTIRTYAQKIQELREQIAKIENDQMGRAVSLTLSIVIHRLQTEKDRLAQKIGKK